MEGVKNKPTELQSRAYETFCDNEAGLTEIKQPKERLDITVDKDTFGDSETEDDDEDERMYPKGLKFALIILALALGLFQFALDATIVATAIPVITAEFGSVAEAGWYGSAYLMTIACVQGPWGKLYKFFRPKWIFLSALIIFTIGSVLCAVAFNSPFLIFGRAVQGVGGGGLTGGVYVILALITPRKTTPIYLGSFGAIFTVASCLGPLLGGIFTDKVSWRWCFWINLPFSVVTGILVIIFFQIPERVKTVKTPWKSLVFKMDPLGTLLITAFIALFVRAMESGGVKNNWDSDLVVGTLVGSVVAVILFGIDQWFMKDDALLQSKFLSNNKILFLCFFAFMLSAVSYSIQYNLPVYFQATKGFSPAESGVNVLPILIISALMTLATSVIYSKYRNDRLYCGLSGILMLVGLVLFMRLGPDSLPVEYLFYQVLIALGIGIGSQIPVLAVQTTVDTQDIPQATSMVLLFQLLSGALAVSASENVLNNIMLQNMLSNTTGGITAAEILAAGSANLKKLFPNEVALKLIAAYTQGLSASSALGVGFGAAALISGLLVGV